MDTKTISPRRLTTMCAAVELGVDADDFRFRSAEERAIWFELADDLELRVDKDDLVWLREAA